MAAHLSGEGMQPVTGMPMLDVSYHGAPAARQMLMREDVAITFDRLASYISWFAMATCGRSR